MNKEDIYKDITTFIKHAKCFELSIFTNKRIECTFEILGIKYNLVCDQKFLEIREKNTYNKIWNVSTIPALLSFHRTVVTYFNGTEKSFRESIFSRNPLTKRLFKKVTKIIKQINK